MIRNKKVLIVCGPTATGKTDLAIYLAKKFEGEIVSADSRQVYKGMDIGTGKDLPKNSKFKLSNLKEGKETVGYYKVGGLRIWGYDLVDPTRFLKKNFSVAQYQKIGERIIADILKRNKLPIIVGGSGLYINALIYGIETSQISPDLKLRKKLFDKSADYIFSLLRELDSKKALAMNNSDRKNKRRLIRAIEIARSKHKIESLKRKPNCQILTIGIKLEREKLKDRIQRRVQKRVKDGILNEIEKLLKSGVSWEDQSMQALGYRQWRGYFEGIESREDAIRRWINEECKYAKRQITWFKKQEFIRWFDGDSSLLRSQVEKEVKRWYKYKV